MAALKYQGGEYTLDFEKITVDEYREIKRKLGLSVKAFISGIDDLDIDAMTGLRWLLLRQADQRLILNADEQFDPWELITAWKAYNDDLAAEKTPDPTLAGSLPAGTTPESTGSSTPTSTTSSDLTSSPSPGTAVSANGKPDVSPSPALSPTSPVSTS